MVLDLVDVTSAQSRGRVAYEGHHEVHAVSAQTLHHLVWDIEKLQKPARSNGRDADFS